VQDEYKEYQSHATIQRMMKDLWRGAKLGAATEFLKRALADHATIYSRLQFASAELTTTRALRRYMLAGDDMQDPIVGPLLVEDVRTQIEKERSEAEREKRRDEHTKKAAELEKQRRDRELKEQKVLCEQQKNDKEKIREEMK
jgi:uncharacterized protein YeeX (DUF496 family)